MITLGGTNYRRTVIDGVFMKDKIVSMGERKTLSPILLGYRYEDGVSDGKGEKQVKQENTYEKNG